MALSRPTLPPLHSLSLPTPAMNSSGSPIESLGLPRLPRLYRRNSVSSSVTSSRTPSLSPPPVDTTASSFSTHPGLSPPPQPTAYPTPSSPDRGRRLSVSTSHPSTSTTFRLIPTTLAHADAILFVPPPTNPALTSLSSVPSISRLARSSTSSATSSIPKDGSMSGISGNGSGNGNAQGRALLLVGPAMNHLRGGKGVRTQIARGARVHPYKIVRSSVSGAGAAPSPGTGGARSKWRSSPTPLIPVRDVRAVGICD